MMKKSITILSFLTLAALTAFCQFPTIQYFGTPTTLTEFRGAAKADSGLAIGGFLDTTHINSNPYIKTYPGMLVRVGNNLLMRNSTANAWVVVNTPIWETTLTAQGSTPFTASHFVDIADNLFQFHVGGNPLFSVTGTGGDATGVLAGTTWTISPDVRVEIATRGVGILGNDSINIESRLIHIAPSNISGTATAAGIVETFNDALTTGDGHYITSNSVTSGKLINMVLTNTGVLTNQTGININFSGAATTGGITTYGIRVSNTRTAPGGSATNYAASFDRGLVGIGTVGTEQGTLILRSSGSGSITIQPQTTSGWTWNLPPNAGTVDYVLRTNGGGTTTWVDPNTLITGVVTSVSGTSNRITSTGGTTPVIDISGSYVGQASITTLGTIGTGVWNATVIGTSKGGTGVDNSTNTSGSFLRSNGSNGNYAASTLILPNAATANRIVIATSTNTYGESANLTFDGNILTETSGVTTGTTTSSALVLNVNSLLAGTGHYIASSSLTSGKAMHIDISGTAALTNQTGLRIDLAGANATGAQRTYGLDISNAHTGTSANVAARLSATGGSNNIALIADGRIAAGGVTTPFADIDVGNGSIAAGSIIITTSAGNNQTGNFSTGNTTLIGGNVGSIYQFLSSTNANAHVFVGGTGASAVPANQSGAVMLIGAGSVPENSTGTHPVMSTLSLLPATITAGVATVTDASTLYIDAPTAATVSGGNYAILIRTGNVQFTNGNFTLGTAGNKVNITTGSNASAGTGTLVAGTATISTTAVTANSLIFVTETSCTNCGSTYISAKTAATSFVVTSTNGADASTFNWWLIN